jgi:hypothetical protein
VTNALGAMAGQNRTQTDRSSLARRLAKSSAMGSIPPFLGKGAYAVKISNGFDLREGLHAMGDLFRPQA